MDCNFQLKFQLREVEMKILHEQKYIFRFLIKNR